MREQRMRQLEPLPKRGLRILQRLADDLSLSGERRVGRTLRHAAVDVAEIEQRDRIVIGIEDLLSKRLEDDHRFADHLELIADFESKCAADDRQNGYLKLQPSMRERPFVHLIA